MDVALIPADLWPSVLRCKLARSDSAVRSRRKVGPSTSCWQTSWTNVLRPQSGPSLPYGEGMDLDRQGRRALERLEWE
jgi:hypothetical protein